MSGDFFGRGTGEDISSEMMIPFLGSIDLRKEYKNTNGPIIKESKIVNKEYSDIVDSLLKIIQ